MAVAIQLNKAEAYLKKAGAAKNPGMMSEGFEKGFWDPFPIPPIQAHNLPKLMGYKQKPRPSKAALLFEDIKYSQLRLW